MKTLYVIVGPAFTGRAAEVNAFLKQSEENIQVIDETAIIRAQKFERVPRIPNYRYGLIAVMARSHLLTGKSVIAFCDNLSIEALVLWKKMSEEHQARCVVVLMGGDQEMAMERIAKINLPKEQMNKMINELANQFKKYDNIAEIFKNKLNTIGRDLADEVLEGLVEEDKDDEMA
jgi:hypothetical protein